MNELILVRGEHGALSPRPLLTLAVEFLQRSTVFFRAGAVGQYVDIVNKA